MHGWCLLHQSNVNVNPHHIKKINWLRCKMWRFVQNEQLTRKRKYTKCNYHYSTSSNYFVSKFIVAVRIKWSVKEFNNTAKLCLAKWIYICTSNFSLCDNEETVFNCDYRTVFEVRLQNVLNLYRWTTDIPPLFHEYNDICQFVTGKVIKLYPHFSIMWLYRTWIFWHLHFIQQCK